VRARIATTVIVAASLLLATTGCSFFAPQSTLKRYDPSDGVGAAVGQVKVRNALLLTSDGQLASFLVSFINDSPEPVDVLVQYDGTTADGTRGKVDTRIQLMAGEVKTFGSSTTPQLVFTGINTNAGSLLPVFVQYGTLTGEQLLVPVLDGSLDEYSTLLPTPLPTTTPSANPTVVPVPSPTATTAP
jgi:hypothetical protein